MVDTLDPCKEYRERFEHAYQEVAKYIDDPNYDKNRCDSLHTNAVMKLQAYVMCLRSHGLKTSSPLWIPACPYPESFKVHEEAGKPISGADYLDEIPKDQKDVVVGGVPKLVLGIIAIAVVAVLLFAFER